MNSKENGALPLKILKRFCCSSCDLQFYIKDFTLKGSRCPMLLSCGHSMCESCIQKSFKAAKVVTCQECGATASLEPAEENSKQFPLSVYLMGRILALQNSRLENNKIKLASLTKSSTSLTYSVKGQSDPNSSRDPKVECEECSLTAFWYCENCKCKLCEICWSRIHGSAKSLMKHHKICIKNVEVLKMDFKKCLQHDGQNLEFFCTGCSTTVCSHCVILYHQGEGHLPITLKDKNMRMLNDVKSCAEEAEKVCKRMRQTLERVQLIQNSSDGTDDLFTHVESQITRNFSRIHGILQLEEDRLLKKLYENWNGRENRLQDLRLQLEKQIENVERLLGEYELQSERLQFHDLADLQGKLKEVRDFPCYLICRNPGEKEAKVAFDERLIELLRIYCKMDLPPQEVFELRSSVNLPKDYAVEPLESSCCDQSLTSAAKGSSELSVSDVDTLSNSSSRDCARGDFELPSSKPSREGTVFLERKNYSVCVTYIKNPGEFYVTTNSQRSRQKAIDSKAFQIASSTFGFPKDVVKGEVYLVKYAVDSKWYRGRITEVLSPGKPGEEQLVSVYYLDYGNSETVPVSRLRTIPAESTDMLVPPLAVKCKLFDCVPKNGEWCTESTKTMEKILNSSTATMFVMKVGPDILEVDLSVIYLEGQIGRDIVSMRDALLFLEFSSFVHGAKVLRHATASKFLHQSLPSVGETFDVVITHVNSPYDFFFQKARQDSSYLYRLTGDLQKYCSVNSEKGFVYNPTVGMPCAAFFSTDGRWYRAKIVEIPGKKMVTVFYVDYGNRETIPWTWIRKLRDNFVSRPPLAFNCSLAGILPTEDSWSNQAISYLNECILMRDCRVQITGRFKSKQKLKVFLYKQTNEKEICVNTLFVDRGYAIKPNLNRFWKVKTAEEKEEQEKTAQNFIFQTDHNKETSGDDSDGSPKCERPKNEAYKHGSGSKLSARKLRELHASRKQKCGKASSSDDDFDDYCKTLRVKVEVLSAESPSSIFVTFPALTAEFENLQTKLNEFYQNSSPVPVEWTEDSVCAVFVSAKSSWYRASILRLLPNDRVEVFLKDLAQVSSEPVSALRELDPLFAKYPTHAVKCHLADVVPPGDKWPSVSCEYLMSELEKCKEVYMTKTEEIENKSLPVELWIQKIELRGALEPNNKEWVTLNRLLVDQGLAVPKRQKIWRGKVPTNEDEDSDRVMEWENKQAVEGDPSDKDAAKEDQNVSKCFVPSLDCRWPPPKPLEKSRFIGKPTYVDFNAHVYMYDAEEDEEKLQEIRQVLVEEYGNSKPSSEDLFWSPGELCIARYHLDNSWYRGLILEEHKNAEYDVLFVDYGNVETCPVSDLRKRVKMLEVPILSRKFQLRGIGPVSENGEWPIPVIDLLHSFIVDKKCQVEIFKFAPNPEDPHVCTIEVMENSVEVGMSLVERGLASFTSLTSDNPEESVCEVFPLSQNLFPSNLEIDSERPLSYSSLSIPNDCSGFFIEVTAVNSEVEFFARIVDHQTPPFSFKKILDEFQNLQRKLKEEGHLQPIVENLLKGQPCCCLHRRSNNWSRGEIESIKKNGNLISVFYVDYGNRETQNRNLIFECKSEWLILPKMAVKLRLGNVKKCSNVSKSAYMKALTVCLNDNLLYAEILNRDGGIPEVKLLTERNGNLAYQEMLDKKLMTFVSQ